MRGRECVCVYINRKLREFNSESHLCRLEGTSLGFYAFPYLQQVAPVCRQVKDSKTIGMVRTLDASQAANWRSNNQGRILGALANWRSIRQDLWEERDPGPLPRPTAGARCGTTPGPAPGKLCLPEKKRTPVSKAQLPLKKKEMDAFRTSSFFFWGGKGKGGCLQEPQLRVPGPSGTFRDLRISRLGPPEPHDALQLCPAPCQGLLGETKRTRTDTWCL